MRMFNALVFDEWLSLPTGGGAFSIQVWPDDRYEPDLGRFDQLAYHLVVEHFSSTGPVVPTIQLNGRGSCDGRNYVVKNAIAEIPSTQLTGASASLIGKDGGTSPSYRLVRPVLTFSSGTGSTASGRFQLFVTARDHGGIVVRRANAGTGYHAHWQPPPFMKPGGTYDELMKRCKTELSRDNPTMWWQMCDQQILWDCQWGPVWDWKSIDGKGVRCAEPKHHGKWHM